MHWRQPDPQANITGANPARRAFQIAANKLLIPAAANGAKKIVKDLGFGEDKANLAKIVVSLPLTLANNVNASAYAANLMNQGRRGFNQNLTANIPRYQNRIDGISRNMLQGDPRSALAQQQIAGINNDITNGQTSIRDLMTRYDALNAAKRDRGLFALGRTDREAAIRNINQVRNGIREEIEILGQSNPQALNNWRNGVQAFSVIHTSNAISNYVESLAKGPYAKLLIGPAGALFGVGSIIGAKAPMVTGAVAGAAQGTYKTGQILYRAWNDPRLANYYWNAINAAGEENTPLFINNYNKLNKELEKSDSSKKNTKSKKK